MGAETRGSPLISRARINMAMPTLGRNLTTCHRCPRRQAICAGACACLEDGRDIVLHARAHDCPLGKFAPPAARGLGDLVAIWAGRLGGERIARAWKRVTGKNCGCQKRREQLNRLVPFRKEGKQVHISNPDIESQHIV
jgi:hypothetical protein